MARRIVKLPDIGEGTTEAEIVAWHVAVGDAIHEDDPLVDVMTDKATVEIPAPADGIVVALHGAVGEKRPVGSDLVVLETDAGSGLKSPDAGTGAAQTVMTARPTAPTSPHPPAAPRPVHPLPQAGEGAESSEAGEGPRNDSSAAQPLSHSRGGKPLASPAVRRRAWDRGVALQFVPGTGPDGRITQKDLDAFLAQGKPLTAPATFPAARDDTVEVVPVVGLRRVIAQRLQESSRQIPHFSYVEEVDVGAVEILRAHLNTIHAARGHLTLLPFLIRAIVRAVAEHPQVNARFDDQAGVLNRHHAVHVGVATQTDSGLMVPVVRHAGAFDLWQAAAEIARLAEAARAGKASREELSGSTITISSLGRLGGIAATPVINRPEVAIVGVNKIVERPVVQAGQIAIARMMNLSSSFDHRIVDGWEAASFIQRVKDYLEHPATMFID